MAITVRAPLVFLPNPRPKWWGINPGGHEQYDVSPFLPTGVTQPPNLYESAVPPKKLPPHIPRRMWGSQAPFFYPRLEVLPPKQWREHLFPNVTAILPLVTPPPIQNNFDGAPPRRKQPPHTSVSDRSQPQPSAIAVTATEQGVPPKRKYPPHMPVRVGTAVTTQPIIPSVLSQLQTEFDPWGKPKKYPAEIAVFPNVALNIVATVTPPPPHGPDYPSKVRLQWTEEAAYPNVAIQPLLIALAQQDVEYSPQGMPRKQWFADPPFPNIGSLPGIQAAGTRIIAVPWKKKENPPEDAAFPNIASEPLFTTPGFNYEYPSKVRFTWPIEPAPQDFWALPGLATAPALYDYPALPAKRWPGDYFPFTNWVQETPPLPPGLVPPMVYDWHWPRHITLTLDDFSQQVLRVAPPIPIYIPEAGYEIYIAPRLFTIATPIRTFFITVPARQFTISRKSVQTFDVKDPDEDWPLSFNMGPDLFAGETLVGPISVTVTLLQGLDPLPAAILNGPAGFDQTSTIVIQPVTGGIAGCSYAIEVTCPTTNPLKTLTLRGVLPVQI